MRSCGVAVYEICIKCFFVVVFEMHLSVYGILSTTVDINQLPCLSCSDSDPRLIWSPQSLFLSLTHKLRPYLEAIKYAGRKDRMRSPVRSERHKRMHALSSGASLTRFPSRRHSHESKSHIITQTSQHSIGAHVHCVLRTRSPGTNGRFYQYEFQCACQ